jgi:hypothetical protein
MKRKKDIMCLLICSLLVSSCSAVIAKSKVEKKELITKKLTIGTPRTEVEEVIGKCYKSEGKAIYFHRVCVPKARKQDVPLNVLMAISTLGIWEIISTPIEAASGWCEEDEIVLMYDKNDRISAIFKEKQYEILSAQYSSLMRQVEALQKNKNYVLLNYEDNYGWSFIDKGNIDYNFKSIFIKIYVKRVLALKEVNYYLSQLKLKSLPVIHYSTFLYDLGNNQYKEISINLYDEKGEVLYQSPDRDWHEMYPDTYSSAIGRLLSNYCEYQELKKYEEKERPFIGDQLRHM